MEKLSRPPLWMRCCARLCDYLLFYLLIAFGFEFAPYFIPEIYFWGLAALTPLLWAPIEALFYSWWGTTPGKAIFGIRVVGKGGKRPPFFTAIKEIFSFGAQRAGKLNQVEVPIWRRYVGVALVALCAIMFGLRQQGGHLIGASKKALPIEHWMLFSPKGEPFSLSLPVDPVATKETFDVSGAPPLVYNDWSAKIGASTVYSISYLDLPKKWTIAGSRTLLKGSLEIVLERTPGATLVEKNFSTHQGHPAIDFRMKQEGSEIQGRLVLINGRVYKVMVTTPANLSQEARYDLFVGSLDIR